MLLIFQLGRLDVWPIDDFGIRKGSSVWKKKKVELTAKEIKPFGEKWALTKPLLPFIFGVKRFS